MGQAQHPIPLVRRKILTHTVHCEIYIREDGPHGVLIDQFFAPFPVPSAHEFHCLIQPLLLRRDEHQLHVDHRLQVEAPCLEPFFGVAVVGGGFFAELAQVCEFDLFVAYLGDHIAIYLRPAATPPQRCKGDSHNGPSEHH